MHTIRPSGWNGRHKTSATFRKMCCFHYGKWGKYLLLLLSCHFIKVYVSKSMPSLAYLELPLTYLAQLLASSPSSFAHVACTSKGIFPRQMRPSKCRWQPQRWWMKGEHGWNRGAGSHEHWVGSKKFYAIHIQMLCLLPSWNKFQCPTTMQWPYLGLSEMMWHSFSLMPHIQ